MMYITYSPTRSRPGTSAPAKRSPTETVFGETAHLGFGNPRAVVAHPQREGSPGDLLFEDQGHMPALTVVLDGVVDEVVDRLLDQGDIALDPDRR